MNSLDSTYTFRYGYSYARRHTFLDSRYAPTTVTLAGLFDAKKEEQRLKKQQAKLEKDLQGLQGRLKNPKFVQNAKPDVVQTVQQQAAEGEQKLAQIEQKLQQIMQLAAAA